MIEVLEQIGIKYINLLWSCFEYDINFYSQNVWIYWTFMIPAFCYGVFMLFKWYLLFLPITSLIGISGSILNKLVITFKKAKKELNQ